MHGSGCTEGVNAVREPIYKIMERRCATHKGISILNHPGGAEGAQNSCSFVTASHSCAISGYIKRQRPMQMEAMRGFKQVSSFVKMRNFSVSTTP